MCFRYLGLIKLLMLRVYIKLKIADFQARLKQAIEVALVANQ